MKKYPSPAEWAEEFRDFVEVTERQPEAQLTERVFSWIREDLNPSPWFVFGKLALIHLVVGTLTLVFCPQFGLRLSGSSGLMGILMRFGPRACMLGCGAEFLAGSILVASFLLRPEEVRVIRRTEFLQIPALGLLSLGAFFFFGEGVVGRLALFWLMGSLASGLAVLEMGWIFRRSHAKS